MQLIAEIITAAVIIAAFVTIAYMIVREEP